MVPIAPSLVSAYMQNLPSSVGIANTTSFANSLFNLSKAPCCAIPHLHGLFPVSCVMGLMTLL